MLARKLTLGTALLVGAALSLSGCGLLDRFTGSGKDADDKESASKSKDEPAAADDTKGTAPERFEDKLFLVGQTAELSGLKVTLAEVKECRLEREASQKALENSGRKLVAARIVFEGTSPQKVTATRQFRAYDSDRVKFNAASLGGTDCMPKLATSRLEAGEKAKGWIGFRVPKGVEGLTMRYEYRPPKQRGDKGTPAKQYPEFTLST
ncbi:MAG: DUF4352 domain-containing protein [Deltaproteobacteria bacterium]|jgi:hypothetical protein|nr:DUF4352 domain-containing protein [Deltaproteobacteria bacterium]MBW2534699.1 DUF4352 domain-containing protein [Deltaproteobacteria bacterium]